MRTLKYSNSILLENDGFSEYGECKRPSCSIIPPPKAKRFYHQDSTRLPIMSTELDASQYCGKF